MCDDSIHVIPSVIPMLDESPMPMDDLSQTVSPLTTTCMSQNWLPQSLDNTTSRTAQGGGGSFKNRKPMGEVDCCESRMAERSH